MLMLWTLGKYSRTYTNPDAPTKYSSVTELIDFKIASRLVPQVCLVAYSYRSQLRHRLSHFLFFFKKKTTVLLLSEQLFFSMEFIMHDKTWKLNGFELKRCWEMDI